MNFDDPRRLYFVFDYISHNAYLAWCGMRDLAAKYDLTLEPVPVLFAALLSQYKQVGPAEIPAKSRWMLWNVLRKAERLGIPIAPPHSHPFNPLWPLRLSCALKGAEQVEFVDRMFRATWVESAAVSDEETVRGLLTAWGLDAEHLMKRAQSDAVKQRLRQNTDRALAVGMFGVPSMMVRGELFWGFDDLENLEAFLDGEDPLAEDRDVYDQWLKIKPSAERSR